VLAEVQVMLISHDRVITETATLQDLNLKEISKDFDSFLARVELSVTADEILAGLVGWFEVEMTF